MNVAQRVLLAIQPGKNVVAKAAYYIFEKKNYPITRKYCWANF
jgi:hypothetical protein